MDLSLCSSTSVFVVCFDFRACASTAGDIPVSLSNLNNLERLDLSSSDVWGERADESDLTLLSGDTAAPVFFFFSVVITCVVCIVDTGWISGNHCSIASQPHCTVLDVWFLTVGVCVPLAIVLHARWMMGLVPFLRFLFLLVSASLERRAASPSHGLSHTSS